MSRRIHFAIGDIHGESEKLAELHDAILERIAFEARPATIIHLGDYVDRGPDSKSVIDRIIALETDTADNPDIEVLSLLGNHERMMLDAINTLDDDKFNFWALNGGLETLASYIDTELDDVTQLNDVIPPAHVEWLKSLPTMIHYPDENLAFVHAGIDPRTFPDCDDEYRLWTRSKKFFDTSRWPDREELKHVKIIHGHTPRENHKPTVMDQRINVDTGACFGGPLTAVMLKDDDAPQFLRAA